MKNQEEAKISKIMNIRRTNKYNKINKSKIKYISRLIFQDQALSYAQL